MSDDTDLDLPQLLRERGLHATAQRVGVLRAVSECPHATADQLAAVVTERLGTISRQAVYDALSVLTDKQLVRRFQPAGSSARYEDRTAPDHHHLVCRSCQQIVDVACVAGPAPCLTPADDAGYQLDRTEVIFWGTCPDCASDPATT